MDNVDQSYPLSQCVVEEETFLTEWQTSNTSSPGSARISSGSRVSLSFPIMTVMSSFVPWTKSFHSLPGGSVNTSRNSPAGASHERPGHDRAARGISDW